MAMLDHSKNQEPLAKIMQNGILVTLTWMVVALMAELAGDPASSN
jgi:hypothetical protein